MLHLGVTTELGESLPATILILDMYQPKLKLGECLQSTAQWSSDSDRALLDEQLPINNKKCI